MTASKNTLSYKGQIKTVKEWSAQFGLPVSTIRARVYQLGWTPEKALEWTGDVPKKDDAERALNAMVKEQLPDTLKPLVATTKTGRLGTFIRNKFRAQFDSWFESEFKPQNTTH